ncbi:Flp pilus assembly protein CpaB [Enterovirga aerilata]|uniref:Flp pilus assembly protein CpaB n=1 Tax=Enterovirga aerilata TaxID=2730920 RepID=A0A849ILW7_9HYPH|nr:Flp pilus assembly protein CpaB [Enterovirga sp. DB1703]NNM74943.1 Flp pilus assembly protein CpaB [Enterovirga sp. DB1703]
MKPARLIVLVTALGAAGLAAVIMMRSGEPAQVVVQTETAPSKSIDVLVASADLPIGQVLKPGDIRWQPWPADLAPTGALTRDAAPNATAELEGSLVRVPFVAGEPMRREKLVRADGAGFMSAILPSGMRALAISIDTRGATSAGGFILPGDRVDVLRIYRDEEASKAGGSDVQVAETLLSNVRVLAIGQNVQERQGERVVTGETATLELNPSQAELLALAQRQGQLSLALRSLADAKQVASRDDRSDGALTVIRAGVARAAPKAR